jgi:hypothetical protein
VLWSNKARNARRKTRFELLNAIPDVDVIVIGWHAEKKRYRATKEETQGAKQDLI